MAAEKGTKSNYTFRSRITGGRTKPASVKTRPRNSPFPENSKVLNGGKQLKLYNYEHSLPNIRFLTLTTNLMI
tara:strand:- start:1278 stop:1496 length:219 start_codon:yes stop_codon:yes gene_type:complete